MSIFKTLELLIAYALKNELIYELDTIYVKNQLLKILSLDKWEESTENTFEADIPDFPQDILDEISDYATKNSLIENDTTSRELFDTKIISLFADRPSNIYNKFKEDKKISIIKATDNFYKFSKKINYIRTKSVARNMSWKVATDYGDLEITVNLSKPEKDPKQIEREKLIPQSFYPKCLLCYQNVGFSGRLNHPARQNLRVIPLNLASERWYMQYSPYVYYSEHAIMFAAEHRPMKINKATFERIADFLKEIPHYFIGSNADLPIVGGSILSHDHYQGGHHSFPMEIAEAEEKLIFKDFEDIDASIIKWPMSVIRIKSKDSKRLVELADKILSSWRDYSDETVEIISHTDKTPHNTVTPIARRREEYFEFDIVLRNNRTNEEHPLGIFHPHAEHHSIKKENIGLIEVMGLAVLPGRLKEEMSILKSYLKEENSISLIEADEKVGKHLNWSKYLINKYENLKNDNIDEILKQEIGLTFSKVLEDPAVFKRTTEGKAAFLRFVEFVNGR